MHVIVYKSWECCKPCSSKYPSLDTSCNTNKNICKPSVSSSPILWYFSMKGGGSLNHLGWQLTLSLSLLYFWNHSEIQVCDSHFRNTTEYTIISSSSFTCLLIQIDMLISYVLGYYCISSDNSYAIIFPFKWRKQQFTTYLINCITVYGTRYQ